MAGSWTRAEQLGAADAQVCWNTASAPANAPQISIYYIHTININNHALKATRKTRTRVMNCGPNTVVGSHPLAG